MDVARVLFVVVACAVFIEIIFIVRSYRKDVKSKEKHSKKGLAIGLLCCFALYVGLPLYMYRAAGEMLYVLYSLVVMSGLLLAYRFLKLLAEIHLRDLKEKEKGMVQDESLQSRT